MNEDLIEACVMFAKSLKVILEKTNGLDCINAGAQGCKKISISEIRKVLAEKCAMGYKDDVRSLLEKYGAEKLSDVDREQYPELLADAVEIGKSIL